LRGVDQHALCHCAPAGKGDDLVARLDALDRGANRLDHAGALAARRKRQRGLELIQVLDDQRVGEVDRCRMHLDQCLMVRGNGFRQFGNAQILRWTPLVAQQRAHDVPIH
jgi:hypothetical protein